ncbi:MAG: glycosyltransferase family 39 protein [Candidatus Alcyoniella australis]|nr:glycosyltransferase family 39 protein [Candidatus Alcyoniella australis]
MRRLHEPLVLLAIVALAAVLRLLGLDDQSLWHDEVSTLTISNRPLADMLALVGLADVNPPLSYALFNLWSRISDAAAWMRLLPALLGIAAVAVLYLLARRLNGPRVAGASALLLAVNPFHVYFSQELRYYTLFALMCLLCTWALMRWIDRRDRRSEHLYVLAAGAAIWTHYFSLFLLLGHAALIVYLRRDAPSWSRRIKAVAKLALLCLPLAFPIAVQLLFNRSFQFRELASVGRSIWQVWISLAIGGPESDVTALLPWIDALPHDSTAFMLLLALLALPFWMLYGCGLIGDKRTPLLRPLLLFCALGPLLVVFLLSLAAPIMRPNYLIGYLPLICLAAGAGFVSLRSWMRYAAWGLLALCIALSLLSIKQARSDPKLQRDDWRGAAQHLAQLASQDDLVLVYHDGAAGGFLHYYHGPAQVEYILLCDPFVFGQLEQQPIEVWIKRNLRKHNPQRVWLVTSYEGFFDPAGFARQYIDANWIRDPRIDFIDYRVEILLFYTSAAAAIDALETQATELIEIAQENFDPLQLARGFSYSGEDRLAWLAPQSLALLRASGARNALELSGFADLSLLNDRPVTIDLELDGNSLGSFKIEHSGLFERRIELADTTTSGQNLALRLSISPSFVPSDVGFPGDDRPKTIQLSRIALVQ